MIPIVVAATMKHHENPCEVIEMKKILMPGDSVIIDGIEFTTEDLKNFLTERIVLKKQLETVKELAGGVTSE